ncbi:MAG: hypothetical protein JWL88_91 [Parcubacteria group bacterium]|nr:hypothetical protein [Parcubacteria group bacterium]
MPTITSIRSDITGGPSKFELMLSLFDRKPNVRTVEFRLGFDNQENAISAIVVINGVSLEDGSGESFCFEGYVQSMKPSLQRDTRSQFRKMKGWYSTASRKGWIMLTD